MTIGFQTLYILQLYQNSRRIKYQFRFVVVCEMAFIIIVDPFDLDSKMKARCAWNPPLGKMFSQVGVAVTSTKILCNALAEIYNPSSVRVSDPLKSFALYSFALSSTD